MAEFSQKRAGTLGEGRAIESQKYLVLQCLSGIQTLAARLAGVPRSAL